MLPICAFQEFGVDRMQVDPCFGRAREALGLLLVPGEGKDELLKAVTFFQTVRHTDSISHEKALTLHLALRWRFTQVCNLLLFSVLSRYSPSCLTRLKTPAL